MNENKDEWYPFSWHCPNCGNKLIGYKSEDGRVKVACDVCHAISVRKEMGRRHNRIDIYAPKGQITARTGATLS